MGLLQTAYRNWIIERPAGKRLPSELAEELERAGREIARIIEKAEDTEPNREALRRMIERERRGQQRLRMALGDQRDTGEGKGRPVSGKSLSELGATYIATREETVAIARELDEVSEWATGSIRHEEMGDLTVRGWLYYLRLQGDRQSKQLR